MERAERIAGEESVRKGRGTRIGWGYILTGFAGPHVWNCVFDYVGIGNGVRGPRTEHESD